MDTAMIDFSEERFDWDDSFLRVKRSNGPHLVTVFHKRFK